jgi:hypothetical protein
VGRHPFVCLLEDPLERSDVFSAHLLGEGGGWNALDGPLAAGQRNLEPGDRPASKGLELIEALPSLWR